MKPSSLKLLLTIVLGLTLGSLAIPAASEELRLVVDPERSEVGFELGATLHSVHGTARIESGEIRFQREGGPASGRVVVAASSADTDNERRDRDMHAKVLESEDFPEIAFTLSETRGELPTAGTGAVEIEGVFSIHGEDHPLEATAEVALEASGLRVTVEFEVPYVDWGMRNPSKLLLKVAKTVTVRVVLVGELSGAE